MFKQVLNLYKLIPKETLASATLLCKSDSINTVLLLPRKFHLTSADCLSDRRDLRSFRAGMPNKDQGTTGENTVNIDQLSEQNELFPNPSTANTLFNGIPYKELPIFNIKVTSNNTIISLTDFTGKVKIIRSCGVEGFKHAKKGTNIAAQTTAVTLSSQALVRGIKTARVRVAGLGPGRMAAIKGLEIGGINIVSITDNTHVSYSPPRPRKQRRI